ncbi:hypothetical protein CFOL_v3_12093 [Cephalotus follicularis]|uniref:Uncharacterized protein n=1 Tax=Cephalotus follicularis TaxID=3775 RepID=A0A1Q3BKP2_CEPFO|nr:hypothetical protein CFOL_v3_12093 [Cephalotus follicularis]
MVLVDDAMVHQAPQFCGFENQEDLQGKLHEFDTVYLSTKVYFVACNSIKGHACFSGQKVFVEMPHRCEPSYFTVRKNKTLGCVLVLVDSLENPKIWKPPWPPMKSTIFLSTICGTFIPPWPPSYLM